MAYSLDWILNEISTVDQIFDRCGAYDNIDAYVVLGYNNETKLYMFCCSYYYMTDKFYENLRNKNKERAINLTNTLDCSMCGDQRVGIDNSFDLCSQCYNIYNNSTIEICDLTYTNKLMNTFDYLDNNIFLTFKTGDCYWLFNRGKNGDIFSFILSEELNIQQHITSYKEIKQDDPNYEDLMINTIVERQTRFIRLALPEIDLVNDIKPIILQFIIDTSFGF